MEALAKQHQYGNITTPTGRSPQFATCTSLEGLFTTEGLFTGCTGIFQLCSPIRSSLTTMCIISLSPLSQNLFLQRRRCWRKQGPGWLTHRARRPRGRLGRSRWRKRGGWHHCRRGESYGQLALRELCLEVVKGKGRVIGVGTILHCLGLVSYIL